MPKKALRKLSVGMRSDTEKIELPGKSNRLFDNEKMVGDIAFCFKIFAYLIYCK